MKRILLFYIIFLSVLCSFASSNGKWTLYPAYRNISYVAPAGKDIFVISSGNLFSYNISDNSLQTYTKNDVLSDVDIKNIAWVKTAGKLVIIYDSGLIDFLSLNGNVTTLSDIADKNMTEDKTINDVFVSGQYVYMATGFGIIKVNVREEYVVDTYKLGVNITAVALKDGYVYARTNSGVLKCKTIDNILNKSSWVNTFEDWQVICPNNNISNEYGTLFFDQTNKCYWGNNNEGMLTRYEKTDAGIEAKTTGVAPDGPFEKNCKNVEVIDGKVFAFPGGWGKKIGDPSSPNKYVSILENGKWSKLDFGDYDNKLAWYGMNCIAIDPRDKNHWMVGAKTGIYEFYNRKFVRHFGIKNGLESEGSNDNYCIINYLLYDKTGRLWISNWRNNRIKYIPSDATLSDDYKIIPLNKNISGWNDLHCFTIEGNSLWFINSCFYFKRGLYEYNMQTDILNEYSGMTNQDGLSLNNEYNDMAIDSQKNIWIASYVGLVYLPYSERGNTNSPIYQHKVPRNDGTNYADYLLNNIDCNAVAIDKYDNKWVGTKGNGVYYISSDNNIEIYHFTTTNSTLPSDYIYNISIDKATGLVYFATEKGLCSFQSDVRGEGNELSDDNVYAYPNPVTPDYTGEITIIGLYPNSNVKILTSSGTLVAEGKAIGGSFIWNGKQSDGRRVASGIYFVAATDEEGNEGFVTKVAVVR